MFAYNEIVITFFKRLESKLRLYLREELEKILPKKLDHYLIQYLLKLLYHIVIEYCIFAMVHRNKKKELFTFFGRRK